MKLIAGVVALLIAGPLSAQRAGPTIEAPCVLQTNGDCLAVSATNPLPMISKQEAFQLVASNTSSAAATVIGGDYILSQTCTAYGTLALQVLGPDAATWQTIITKTASDTAGGTGLSLGSYAQVRVTVTGTTGCNALLARVPA